MARLRVDRFALTALVAALSGWACGVASQPAAAQDAVAAFYKDKQIRIIIRSTAGGSYDLYSRLIGRHIGKYIPGNPVVVPINMPGAGGLTATNFVAQIAPKDGTHLIIPSLGVAMYQALDFFGDKLKGDMREFQWIGNVTTSNPVVVTWHASQVKSLEDARKHVAHLGTSGAGSISAQLPAVYNNLLGTRFKVIYGYDGDDGIAMERGEIDGRATNTWASYKAVSPDWVQNKRLNYILQIGLKKEPELPDVPLLRELAKTPEEQQIFDFFSKVAALTRPMATSPKTPPERVAMLRAAFKVMMADKDFIADAAKQSADISLMDGETVQRLTEEILDTPKPLLAKVNAVMRHRDGDEVQYQKKK